VTSTQALRASAIGDRGERAWIAVLGVVGGHDDGVGAVERLGQRHGRRSHVRIMHRHVG
jgi:hypothetical protein